MSVKIGSLLALMHLLLSVWPAPAAASEKPYFVVYDHSLEEPGNLEFSFTPVIVKPRSAPAHVAAAMEFEYGVKGWWTTEIYLDGQKTLRDSTLYTGYRWENRFRLMMNEHWINPVFYIEYEHLNGADKSLKEVVGFDSERKGLERNSELRTESEREIELKLILSSNFKGWNISENMLAVKNLANSPWEFGYAIGLNRPLALAASSKSCTFCRENFRAGIELYGGLGDWHQFGTSQTSQYVAPVLSWELPGNAGFHVSPSFGLTRNSHRFLLRVGISYEWAGFRSRISRFRR